MNLLNEVHIPLVSSQTNLEDVASVILAQAMKLTKSPLGYVGEVTLNPKSIAVISIIPPLKNESHSTVPIIRRDEKNIYGDLMRQSVDKKESIFTNAVPSNNFKNCEHFKVDKFLSVPVLEEGVVVGQISEANTSKDYSANEVEAMERLADFYILTR